MKLSELAFVFNSEALETLKQYQDPEQPDLISQMFDIFRIQATEFEELLLQKSTENQLSKIEKNAHKFKSSCNHLGAESLAQICTLIESECRKPASEQNLSQLEQYNLLALEHLKRTFTALEPFLRRQL